MQCTWNIEKWSSGPLQLVCQVRNPPGYIWQVQNPYLLQAGGGGGELGLPFSEKKVFRWTQKRRKFWFIPSEFRLFRGKINARNSGPTYSTKDKKGQSYIPTHFLEDKNTGIFVILFRAIKMLGIPFRTLSQKRKTLRTTKRNILFLFFVVILKFGGMMPLFLFIFIFPGTHIHSIKFIQYIHSSPLAEVPLHLLIAG